VLLTGKVKEAVVRAVKGRPVYDAVVLDGPPTGRIARFLNISSEIGGLAKVGPLKTQSDGVMAVFRSPQTAVHLVTLLEEMPGAGDDRRRRRAGGQWACRSGGSS
jgi:anion-transporting  ArsA/GET3 family ATPase